MKDEKDWSKEIDVELIRKAQTDYKIGTVFESVRDGLECTVNEGFVTVSNDSVYVDGNKVFCCIKNQWAEIVNQPKEASPEAQKEFEENNPGMIFKAEPKAGDMVEYCFDEPNGWGGGNYIGMREGLYVIWTGLKYIESTAIRLTQKSEVESKVDELKERFVSGKEIPRNIVKEAIKWGQQNPDKI